jgi:mono/diheme cytochrome c family protein
VKGRAVGISLVALAVACAVLARRPAPEAPRGEALPELGTRLGQFPEGPMKAVADQACLNCHSADMTLQQRLNDKQWAAEIDKMTGWGAVVPEDQKAALIAYLAEHFGPDNDRFAPVVAAPAK